MLRHQLSILFIFLKIAILRVEYLITKLSNELFEEATAVDAVFDHAHLIDELDGQLVFHVELLLENLVVGVFEDSTTIYLNRMRITTIVLPLHIDQMLEYFRAETEGNCVWNVDNVCMTHCTGDFLVVEVVESRQNIFLDDPEILWINLKPFVSFIEGSDRFLQVLQEVLAKPPHGLLGHKHTVGNVVENPRYVSDLVSRNERLDLLSRFLPCKLKVINNNQPLLNDETKEVQKLFILYDLLEYWLIILNLLISKMFDQVSLLDVLK